MLAPNSTHVNQTTSTASTKKADPLAALIPKGISLTITFSTLASLIALFFGWKIRREYWLTAESGWGYALGIIGGMMMLLLLIYPMRKRFYHSSLFIFSTKNWFKLHMALGVIGPLLVLYHCNFSFGSTNSNVALASMLLMVASGLIGRFIYGKMHYGLYGKKTQLKELQTHKLIVQKKLSQDRKGPVVIISDTLIKKLKAYEKSALTQRGLLGNLFNILSLGLTTRWGYFGLIRRLRLDQKNNRAYNALPNVQRLRHFNPVKVHVAAYLSTIRKIAELSFYERFFSLWHMLHLPIFFMLIITGFVHVYAVHAY
jgi:hypothetical protein